MKKKYLAVAALAAVLGISTACGSKNDKPVDPKPDVPVEPAEKTGTVTIATVTNGTVTADKTSGKVGETITLTIKANEGYELDFVKHGDTKLEVKDGKASFKLVEGENKITAAFKAVEAPKPEEADPTLTLEGKKELTVAAGTEIALPTATAKDYLGKDLTSTIEIEDTFESGTIKEGKFLANIAGTHEISYYVEDEGGRYAEDFVTVTVTAAHEETFDITDANDPAAMKTYGTFKENFGLGMNSPLAAYGNTNNAAYLTGTDEAINGNSLVIDMNRTSGAAANSIFLNAFNDHFNRGIQATYKVSFKYKLLTADKNWGDVFFGLSWDESTGLNQNFITDAKCKQNEVYEASFTFPGVAIPEAGNAYFMFFKLSGAETDCKIAFDDFTFTCTELAQVTTYEPTSDELLAEGGFTWDFETKGAVSSNSEAVLVDNIENETAKAAMKASGKFSKNALKLINADDHKLTGVSKNNLVAGKKLVMEITYYSVNNEGLVYLMMGNGNPEWKYVRKDLGNGMFTDTIEGKVVAGYEQLNIYGKNNAKFEIYLAQVNAKLVDADVVPEGQTDGGHKVGDNWNFASRAFGNQDKTGCATEAFDNKAEVIENKAMGEAPTKLTFRQNNQTMEWCQMGGKMETGCKYKITTTYYVDSWTDGRLMFNIDNSTFFEIANGGSEKYMTPGFHQETIEVVSPKVVDYFSFYVPGDATCTGVIYIGNVNVELVEIAK